MNRWFLRFAAAILSLSTLADVTEALMSVSRAGCGRSKVCVEDPTSCDPSGSGPCQFASAAVDQSKLSVGLRGDTEGYIALGLQHSQNNGTSTVFACARNGSNVFLRTMLRNNSNPDAPLTPVDMPVMNFTGSLNGSVVSCSFSVPLSNVTKGSNNSTFTLLLGNGTVARDFSLGALKVSRTEGPVDLMNFRNETGMTTAAPTTAPTTAPAALSITRSGCGQSKLCVETPKSCDPSGAGSCLFTSVSVNQSELSVALRGDSEGYVALGFTSSSQETSPFFVCGKTNSTFFFQTAQRNNSVQNAPLTKTNITVAGVRGEVKGNVTKCIFKVQSSELRNKTKTSSDLLLRLILGTGTVNGTTLGSLRQGVITATLNFSNHIPTTPVGRAAGPVAPLSALVLSALFYTLLIN